MRSVAVDIPFVAKSLPLKISHHDKYMYLSGSRTFEFVPRKFDSIWWRRRSPVLLLDKTLDLMRQASQDCQEPCFFFDILSTTSTLESGRIMVASLLLLYVLMARL